MVIKNLENKIRLVGIDRTEVLLASLCRFYEDEIHTRNVFGLLAQRYEIYSEI